MANPAKDAGRLKQTYNHLHHNEPDDDPLQPCCMHLRVLCRLYFFSKPLEQGVWASEISAHLVFMVVEQVQHLLQHLQHSTLLSNYKTYSAEQSAAY